MNPNDITVGYIWENYVLDHERKTQEKFSSPQHFAVMTEACPFDEWVNAMRENIAYTRTIQKIPDGATPFVSVAAVALPTGTDITTELYFAWEEQETDEEVTERLIKKEKFKLALAAKRLETRPTKEEKEIQEMTKLMLKYPEQAKKLTGGSK